MLLNDPTYVEAARAFAARILREGQGRPDERHRLGLAAGARSATRAPTRRETVRELLDKHLADYRTDPAAAEHLLKTGLAPTPGGLDAAELAAWTHVARVLLNLHETITRS